MTTLTAYAASLGAQGKVDEGLAVMPKAAAAVHDNAPELFSWLLFQWGRLYELKGDFATARDFFAEAHRRLPGYLEATSHLAQAMMQTGDTAGAKKLVDGARSRSSGIPSCSGWQSSSGIPSCSTRRSASGSATSAALPEAFSDHAARFYLTVDPARALVLARSELANRDTTEARALVGEAALAAGDPEPPARSSARWPRRRRPGRSDLSHGARFRSVGVQMTRIDWPATSASRGDHWYCRRGRCRCRIRIARRS